MLQVRDGGGVSIQLIWLVIVVVITLLDMLGRRRRKAGSAPAPPAPGDQEAELEEAAEDDLEELPAGAEGRARPQPETAEDWVESPDYVEAPPPPARRQPTARDGAPERFEDRAKVRLEEQIDEWLRGGGRRGAEEEVAVPRGPARERPALDHFESDLKEVAEARYASILERRGSARQAADAPFTRQPLSPRGRTGAPIAIDPKEARRAIVLMTVLGPCRGNE